MEKRVALKMAETAVEAKSVLVMVTITVVWRAGAGTAPCVAFQTAPVLLERSVTLSFVSALIFKFVKTIN